MLRKKSVVLLALGVLTLTLFGCVQTARLRCFLVPRAEQLLTRAVQPCPKHTLLPSTRRRASEKKQMRTPVGSTRLRIFLRASTTLPSARWFQAADANRVSTLVRMSSRIPTSICKWARYPRRSPSRRRE